MKVWGQAPLSVGGETLRPHGYNSAGEHKNPGSEERDSVTTGSTSKYYVVPDATLNTGYTGILTGTLTTSFTWSAVNASGAGISSQSSINPAYTNYKQITWTGIGTLDLSILETNSATGCSGSPKVIPVTVIPAPTCGFAINNQTVKECLTEDDGSLNYKPAKTFSMTFSSAIDKTKQDIKVKINVKGLIRSTSVNLELDLTRTGANTGTITLPPDFTLNLFDTYEITLVSVSDRISRKNNYWNAATGKYTLNVYPVPQTGAVQHITNM